VENWSPSRVLREGACVEAEMHRRKRRWTPFQEPDGAAGLQWTAWVHSTRFGVRKAAVCWACGAVVSPGEFLLRPRLIG
jgi:hypothetical protein